MCTCSHGPPLPGERPPARRLQRKDHLRAVIALVNATPNWSPSNAIRPAPSRRSARWRNAIWRPRVASDATCMRTPAVKRGPRPDLQHGHVSSGGAVRRLVLPGRNALAPVAPWGAHPTCIRAVAGVIAGPSLDPACLRAPRSGGGTQLLLGVLQPNSDSVTRHPAQCRPRPAGPGTRSFGGSRSQATRAPVGTRPVSAYRQRATRSLRATATIMTLRIRPRAPAVRAWNHWLSALSGW